MCDDIFKYTKGVIPTVKKMDLKIITMAVYKEDKKRFLKIAREAGLAHYGDKEADIFKKILDMILDDKK